MRISDWSSDVCSSDLDVSCADTDLENSQIGFARKITALLDAGHFPIGMGGGHEIAYASYLGLVNSDIALGKRIAIVNLDAHFDLRESSVASSRSEEHTSELQSLMRTSYAVFCLKTKTS